MNDQTNLSLDDQEVDLNSREEDYNTEDAEFNAKLQGNINIPHIAHDLQRYQQ